MLVFSASGINPCVQTHGQTGMAAWSMECPHSSNTLATNPRSTSSAGWLHKYNVLKCHISINKSVLFLWNQKRWRQLSFFFLSYRTKIFIRFPKTLFATEDALEVRKHSLGTSHIQKHTVSCVTVHWMVCVLLQMLTSTICSSCTATKLQSSWKGYSQKTKYRKMRQSAIRIQAWWRGILARREAKRRREAVNTIRRSVRMTWLLQ